ncbi:hypothetical protein [Cylindrospermopsis raciborskii]|uniref:hypothetical protein n=1 Tax=Cylindrospermopsis raciborskii TaxID=77022 RepID=UPI001177A54A|nr:hypothetical protein [Cylindrospermopsis raciborskii]
MAGDRKALRAIARRRYCDRLHNCSLAIEYKRIYGYDEVRKYSWEGMISQCTYEASDLTFGLNSNSGNKKRIKTLIEEARSRYFSDCY